MNVRFILRSFVALLWFFLAVDAQAAGTTERTPAQPLTVGNYETLIDVGNLTSWVRNDALFDWKVGGDYNAQVPKFSTSPYHSEWEFNGAWNGTFPKGTVGGIFTEGVVWGGLVNDGNTQQQMRVGGSGYVSSLSPGAILRNGSGAVTGAEDPSSPSARVFRVRPDWRTADLRDDAANYYRIPANLVTADQMAALRAQYQKDWNEWPAAKGAPFWDVNANGNYDPTVDIPGVKGADQTTWFVANDLDVNQSMSFYGSIPIGLELQYTMWAYHRGGLLDDVIFKKTKLIYRGTPSTPAGSTIEGMYLGQYCDPDDGDQYNDLVGCDSTVNLGYVWHDDDHDRFYDRHALFPPPSFGYKFLNMTMTSFARTAMVGPRHDPGLGEYWGGRQLYNMLRGVEPLPPYPDYVPMKDPDTTKHRNVRFEYNGNIIQGWGETDAHTYLVIDRKMLMSTGAFSMNLGDSRELVVALCAGMAPDPRASSWDSHYWMRQAADVAQQVYWSEFKIVPPAIKLSYDYSNPSSTVINIRADARGTGVDAINVHLVTFREYSWIAQTQLYDDGAHNDGAAGDGIFGGSISVYPQQLGVSLGVEVSGPSGSGSFEGLVERIPTAGSVRVTNPIVVSDNINNDKIANPGENVRYTFKIQYNGAFDIPKANITTFTYEYPDSIKIPKLTANSTYTQVYNANDSSTAFDFNVPSGYADSTFQVYVTVGDTNGNRWYDTLRFPVQRFSSPPYALQNVTHTGPGEWGLGVSVVNPSAVKLNHQYEVTIQDSINQWGQRGYTIKDLNTNITLYSGTPLPDGYGHNAPIIDGFKILRGENFGRVGLRNDSTRWISSNPCWITGAWFQLDPNSAFNGGVTTGDQLSNYFYHLDPTFNVLNSVPVEVRFDVNNPTMAYRLERTGPTNGGYMIQPWDSFMPIPMTAWDVSDRAHPRQLALAWRDQNSSSTWNPSALNDSIEIVYIYYKSYDPNGNLFHMPPNVIENECVAGPRADIMYALSLQVVTGHQLNESTGTLYLRPWYSISHRDTYRFTVTSTTGVAQDNTPYTYSLQQNYPNPFNPTTLIHYSLARPEHVRLSVYNVLGQEVARLVDDQVPAGAHEVQWRAVNSANVTVSSGVYFYRIDAGTFHDVKKMMLIR